MDKDLKEFAREMENSIERLSKIRCNQGVDRKLEQGRSEQERDYARILYSSSFRRLQGKMQLFIPYTNRFNRNRLTHSLEVAQISRVIAHNLGLKDTITIQSVSLAHDIGHPPFGHAGEKTLNSLSKNIKFEGNAQTFRILNHLEEKHYKYNGLNLSYRTLLGTVKYFQNSSMNPKKFLYDEDYQQVSEMINEDGVKLKTIDAQIMDIADEIAYAAHDLEDALYFKWFTIDELVYEFTISEKYKDACGLFKNIVEDAKNFASKSIAYESSEEYTILFKKELTSNIVNTLVNNLCVKDNQLAYKEHYDLLSEGLKRLTFNAVSRSSINIMYELKGKKIVTDLYTVYMDKKFNKDMQLLPVEYRNEEEWERTVFDYISAMMDQYAIEKHKEYFGENALESTYSGAFIKF